MSFWTVVGGLAIFNPSLPDHCEPTNAFLYHLSSTFHICVPTPLAFISTLLGSLSILAWLFAQLPQIWKNYRLHSTSGLSIFFLGEWFLGDFSNLLGSIFTRQATWQVVLASYYCFVDIVLLCQWIWYGLLKHGRPLRNARSKSREKRNQGGGADIIEGLSVQAPSDDPRSTSSKPIDAKRLHPARHHALFRTPQYASPPASPSPSSSPSVVSSSTPRRPTILRPGTSPMPSPRTILFITMLLAVLSRASPTHLSAPVITPLDNNQDPQIPIAQAIGQLFSWLSTLSYLGSRLPQLYKNHTRRSTSGLSPILFLAAFTGNFFYSTSLFTNPCAWNTFGPYGGRGWAGPEGSERGEWVGLALPFFLGAAGVLLMDGMVGLQFWMFSEGKAGYADGEDTASVVQEPFGGEEEELEFERRWRWRRVDGWMRGWVPSVSVAGTPMGGGTPRPASLVRGEGERDGLLRRREEDEGSKAYGAVGG